MIHPLSTQDVSGILAFVQAHGIEIAVCGAGHNHRGNSVDDGLVVDLRKMNAVSVDPVNRTIMTQGAAVWGSVYEAAGKHGLAAVGGLVPSVGVGGFTLNGGLGCRYRGRAPFSYSGQLHDFLLRQCVDSPETFFIG